MSGFLLESKFYDFNHICTLGYEHLEKARTCPSWQGRAVHVVVGCLEYVPILGQLIALVEIAFARCFQQTQINIPRSNQEGSSESTSNQPPQPSAAISSVLAENFSLVLPDPVSRRPRKGSLSLGTDNRYLWPRGCIQALIGSQDRAQWVDLHLRASDVCFKSVFKKKMLECYLTEDATEPYSQAQLPCTLIVSKNQVFIKSKCVLAKGGERAVKFVYNLSTGEWLIKKRVTGVYEQAILSHLVKERSARGLQGLLIVEQGRTKAFADKVNMIEMMRDGDLGILFGTNALVSWSARYQLTKDLIQDLNSLHSLSVILKLIQEKEEGKIERKPTKCPVYHADISFGNILVFLQEAQWHAELSDFGRHTASYTTVSYSVGFTPPEYIAWLVEDLSRQASIFDFHFQYGQGRDIWSMGLVLLSILLNKKETITLNKDGESKVFIISPLQCLKNCLAAGETSQVYEKGILGLTQEMIDDELADLEKTALAEDSDAVLIRKLFGMVKAMLRIDPTERAKVEAIASML